MFNLLKLVPLRLWLAVGAALAILTLGWAWQSSVKENAQAELRAESAEKALERAQERLQAQTKADVLAEDNRAAVRASVASTNEPLRRAGADLNRRLHEAAPDIAAAPDEHRLFLEAVGNANRAIEGSR